MDPNRSYDKLLHSKAKPSKKFTTCGDGFSTVVYKSKQMEQSRKSFPSYKEVDDKSKAPNKFTRSDAKPKLPTDKDVFTTVSSKAEVPDDNAVTRIQKIVNLAYEFNTKILQQKGSGKHTNPKGTLGFLDNLAKVLYKGDNYTAIGQADDFTCIGFKDKGRPEYLSLSQPQVDDLLSKLKTYLKAKDDIHAKDLLNAMIKAGNDIIMRLTKFNVSKVEDSYKNNREKKDNPETILETVPSKKNGPKYSSIDQYKAKVSQPTPSIPEPDDLLTSECINFLIKKLNLSQLPLKDMPESITVISEEQTKQILGRLGVHVEMKVLWFLFDKFNPKEKEEIEKFKIGLATNEPHLPGCCACCAAEIQAIEKIKNFSIQRVGDYKYNFPRGGREGFQLSNQLTSDDTLFGSFREILCEAVRDIIGTANDEQKNSPEYIALELELSGIQSDEI